MKPIELLIISAILIVLAISVFITLDPAKRIKDAKDVRRSTDIDSVLTAVHEYIVDNKGSLPTGLSTGMAEKQLGTGTSGCTIASGGCAVAGASDCVNLATPLTKYLKTIPVDPDGTVALTKYSIVVDVNNIVTVKACGAEGGTNISISR